MVVKYYQLLETIVPFIPLILGAYVYKSLGGNLKILFYYVCFSSVASIISQLISSTGTTTFPAAHFYVPLEFIILVLFYMNYLTGYINKKFTWFIISGFVLLCLLNVLFFQDITEYPNIPRGVESIILVVFSVLYFHKVMVEAKIKKLAGEPMIWINTGILIYFSGDFFFHLSLPLALAVSAEFARKIVYFFWATNIFFYLILAVGFYKQKRLAVR